LTHTVYDHNISTSVTSQTDGQTTCHGNITFCVASRGNKRNKLVLNIKEITYLFTVQCKGDEVTHRKKQTSF